jgi:hypothetical protein
MTKTADQRMTGYGLLHNPRLNKGTAFTDAERRAYGLDGLLPPTVLPIELQVARRHDEIAGLDDNLQKYLVLSDLQARNETLYYAVLMSDPATYMPLVYTPTVGEACQKFGHIRFSFRAARRSRATRPPGTTPRCADRGAALPGRSRRLPQVLVPAPAGASARS